MCVAEKGNENVNKDCKKTQKLQQNLNMLLD